MEEQGQRTGKTVTLKELGLTHDAWTPLLISVIVFLLVGLTGLVATMPAWYVLGVGRPFLPEFFMPISAFVLLLITTGGLSVAWGSGTISLLGLWEVLGKRTTFATVRLFTGLTLLIVWFLVDTYLNIYTTPRPELASQLLSQNPALHYALYTFHHYNDWMHFVFVIGALAMIWGYGEGLLRSRAAQVITLCLIWLTFFSLSLTIGLHSVVVRLIPG